jgi:hypothetical protein
MINTVNILMGPKLGDFLHSLVVPKYLYQVYGMKTNLYLIEKHDKFFLSLRETYDELYPIISKQEYINSFRVYDNFTPIRYDLNTFRFSPLLSRAPFWAVFMKHYFPNLNSIPRNMKILDIPKNDKYKDYLIVHRRDDRSPWTPNVEYQYKNILDQYENKIFIDNKPDEYNKFKFKNEMDLEIVTGLEDLLSAVSGCKIILTNPTVTLAMATVMNVPRIGELHEHTINHYAHDHLFYDNVEFFDTNNIFTPNCQILKEYKT